jgi:hypothetical protein
MNPLIFLCVLMTRTNPKTAGDVSRQAPPNGQPPQARPHGPEARKVNGAVDAANANIQAFSILCLVLSNISSTPFVTIRTAHT